MCPSHGERDWASHLTAKGGPTAAPFSNGDSWTGNSYALTSDPVLVSLHASIHGLRTEFSSDGGRKPVAKRNFRPSKLSHKDLLSVRNWIYTTKQCRFNLQFENAIPITRAVPNFYSLQAATQQLKAHLHTAELGLK